MLQKKGTLCATRFFGHIMRNYIHLMGTDRDISNGNVWNEKYLERKGNAGEKLFC